MTRDQKQLVLWIVGLAAALGSVGPNLHVLVGCRCQLYSVRDIADWAATALVGDYTNTVERSHETISSHPAGGLIPSSDCYACRVLAGVSFWPPSSGVVVSLDTGKRQVRLGQLSVPPLEVCDDCLPRGPPVWIS